MKPELHTYEAWLLDRWEGRLTAEQERELEAFLLLHPDLRPEPGPLPIIGPGTVEALPKESLYRSLPPKGMPDPARLDDFLAARMEGELDAAQEQALDLFLQRHPWAAKQAQWMALARMEPVPMAFPGKERLKRRRGLVIPIWGRMAAAASVLLLVGLGIRFNEGPDPTMGPLVRLEKPLPTHPGKDGRTGAETPSSASGGATAVPDTEIAHGSTSVHGPRKERASLKERHDKEPAVDVPRQAALAAKETVKGSTGATDPLPLADDPGPVAHAPEPIGQPVIRQGVQGDEAPVAARPVAQQASAPAPTDQTLGQALANITRERVLNSQPRRAVLDGEDLLAMADKAAGALGGGVELQRSGEGGRLRLRLGRRVSISVGVGR